MKNDRLMMIVDDLKINREILSEVFQNDFDILEAEDGKKAVDLLESGSRPTIILLDVMMPHMDGMEVLAYLHSHSEFCEIPVIVETAAEDGKEEVKALELGAVDFIRKPFRLEVVRYRVENVLNRRNSLKPSSGYDRLTGIYDKETFYRKTKQLVDGNLPELFVVILMDIERFKLVNDLFGTDIGDSVLTEIASCLKNFVKDKGICGRLEGDNFALCMPERQFSMQELLGINDRCIKRYELKLHLEINYGIYRIDDRTLPASVMCDRARLALQTVKGNYREYCAEYDSKLRSILLEEQQIVSEMNAALLDGQFCIYLQPIYNRVTGQAVTAEALVRWIHPKKGIMPPDKFIPIFERNGFIARLDLYVCEEACKVLSSLSKSGQKALPISVNLSRIDFYNPNLCEDVMALVQKYELDINMLKIEITETTYTENSDQMMLILDNMRKNGLEIYMDDFGSGYSSLNMLKDVPVDILKVDMQFLNGIETSKKAGSILDGIHKMAMALDMLVIAEGVETKGQLDILGEIGCERVQGYYYSKPLPVEEYLRLMSSKNTENRT